MFIERLDFDNMLRKSSIVSRKGGYFLLIVLAGLFGAVVFRNLGDLGSVFAGLKDDRISKTVTLPDGYHCPSADPVLVDYFGGNVCIVDSVPISGTPVSMDLIFQRDDVGFPGNGGWRDISSQVPLEVTIASGGTGNHLGFFTYIENGQLKLIADDNLTLNRGGITITYSVVVNK